MISSNARVGFLKSAAVRAFPVLMRPAAANVPSMRERASRFPPSSTTATAPVVLRRRSSDNAAATTFSAPASVKVFFSTTCAGTAVENRRRATDAIAGMSCTILWLIGGLPQFVTIALARGVMMTRMTCSTAG